MRQGTKREDCNTKAANDLATLHGNAKGLKLAQAGVHPRNRKEPHHLRASAADQPALVRLCAFMVLYFHPLKRIFLSGHQDSLICI